MTTTCSHCLHRKRLIFKSRETGFDKNRQYQLDLCEDCAKILLGVTLSGIDGDLYSILIKKFGRQIKIKNEK